MIIPVDKNMKYILLSILLSGCTWLPLQAQQVTKVHIGDNQNYGITYSLPKQEVHIRVTATCTQVKAGIFASYAEKYLGVKDAPMDDYVTWQISQATMSVVSVPDTAQTYHIQFSDKVLAPTFYLGTQRQLLGINKEPDSLWLRCVTQPVDDMYVAAEQPVEELRAVNVMNEELLKAGSKTKQAEIAARQIFRIRESRLNLLTGDVDNLPADGLSFQLVLDNLKAQEQAYMELFTGVVSTSTVVRDFVYQPKTATAGSQVLFRFSSHFGFVDNDDLSGEPYSVQVSVVEDNRKVPVLKDAKGRPLPPATGVAYLVPGRACVELIHKGQSLASGTWQMSQFGHVEYFSSAQFTNKKAPASALFDPNTGAITLISTPY